MGCPVATSARIYRPRRPRESPLYQLLDRYYDRFERVYDQRYQKRYGFWRPVIWRTVDLAAGRRCLRIKVLACGDLKEGFARGRCTAISPLHAPRTHGSVFRAPTSA